MYPLVRWRLPPSVFSYTCPYCVLFDMTVQPPSAQPPFWWACCCEHCTASHSLKLLRRHLLYMPYFTFLPVVGTPFMAVLLYYFGFRSVFTGAFSNKFAFLDGPVCCVCFYLRFHTSVRIWRWLLPNMTACAFSSLPNSFCPRHLPLYATEHFKPSLTCVSPLCTHVDLVSLPGAVTDVFCSGKFTYSHITTCTTIPTL